MATATIIDFGTITSIVDVRRFIEYLIKGLGLNWHPDDAFIDYVYPDGEPVFTEEQALVLEDLLEQAFFLCEGIGADLYEIGLDILLEHLAWAKIAA